MDPFLTSPSYSEQPRDLRPDLMLRPQLYKLSSLRPSKFVGSWKKSLAWAVDLVGAVDQARQTSRESLRNIVKSDVSKLLQSASGNASRTKLLQLSRNELRWCAAAGVLKRRDCSSFTSTAIVRYIHLESYGDMPHAKGDKCASAWRHWKIMELQSALHVVGIASTRVDILLSRTSHKGLCGDLPTGVHPPSTVTGKGGVNTWRCYMAWE
ncbi:hypothetical protein C8F04DRAFT_1196212 [Mycena alexandri]|uniref:Uncharacterized protein n=1 Tax=Mycena alexandri TaxID=1745969 RepID=A0AAD6S403_9AGAR|nr:hypothetical protein C8F04DRAFT_1196212 [Mycena alexandri]